MYNIMIVLIILPIVVHLYSIVLLVTINKHERSVIKYLREHNMQEDLDYLEIGFGNIRGFKYAKKIKKYYSTETENTKLNELKKIVWKKRNQFQNALKLLLLVVVVMVVSSFPWWYIC